MKWHPLWIVIGIDYWIQNQYNLSINIYWSQIIEVTFKKQYQKSIIWQESYLNPYATLNFLVQPPILEFPCLSSLRPVLPSSLHPPVFSLRPKRVRNDKLNNNKILLPWWGGDHYYISLEDVQGVHTAPIVVGD